MAKELLELVADDLAAALYETYDFPTPNYVPEERNLWLLKENNPKKWEAYRKCSCGLLARLLHHYACRIDPNGGEFL